MGTWINFSNVITIGKKTVTKGAVKSLAYDELDAEMIQTIASNEKINCIQINQNLPCDAFRNIDKLLELRPGLSFRVFGLYQETYFDLDQLQEMPHLQSLKLDVHLRGNPRIIEPGKVCRLENLKELSLNLFDLKDYSFIKGLNSDLESLQIMADTMGGAINFDCKWLLEFAKLNSLWLGKKAKKNVKAVGEIPTLRSLALRGIKVDDFYFLQDCGIEELRILWCGMNDLSSLLALNHLKYLELWRINKLDDISMISGLVHLETVKLQDLRHIHELPDLSGLHNLKELVLINIPINEDEIPDELKPFIKHW